MAPNTRDWAATALAVVAVALAGCGGSTSVRPPASAAQGTPVTRRATAIASRSPNSQPGPPPQAAAPAPSGPVSDALVQKLTPLLLKTVDLPQSFAAFQPNDATPVSNADYTRGQPNPAEIQARLEKDGRLGGVQTGWSAVGQYQHGQQLVTTLLNNVSEFQTADGARDGLALIFSQLTPSGTSRVGDQFVSQPIALGSFGDESRVYRIEQAVNLLVGGTPTSVPERVKQVFLTAALRRGKAIAFINVSALNTDPSPSDLQHLLQVEDQRLKDAGY